MIIEEYIFFISDIVVIRTNDEFRKKMCNLSKILVETKQSSQNHEILDFSLLYCFGYSLCEDT